MSTPKTMTPTSANTTHKKIDFSKFTKETLMSCEVYQQVKDKYMKRLKNSFVILEESDEFVAFKMVKYNFQFLFEILLIYIFFNHI
jgi:hypothetical protein